ALSLFYFHAPATTEIHTLSLHDALPIFQAKTGSLGGVKALSGYATTGKGEDIAFSILSNNLNVAGKRVNDTIDSLVEAIVTDHSDRKSTRLNSSHDQISYAVFCLKKKNT